MLENPDFERDYYSRKAESIFKVGDFIITFVKWLA